MTTEVWITFITSVLAPVVLRVVAHYYPPLPGGRERDSE